MELLIDPIDAENVSGLSNTLTDLIFGAALNLLCEFRWADSSPFLIAIFDPQGLPWISRGIVIVDRPFWPWISISLDNYIERR